MPCFDQCFRFISPSQTKTQSKLTYACNAAAEGKLKIVMKYVEYWEMTDTYGSTMLHYAVKAQQLRIVSAMVNCKSKKINLDLQDRELLTPLQWSVLVPHANVDITLCLLKRNADWNVKTQDGRSLLDLAVLQPSIQMLQALIQSIGSPLLEDYVTSALKIAISFQKREHVHCLCEAIHDDSALLLAVLACAENEAIECAKVLMEARKGLGNAITQNWTLLLFLSKQAVSETFLNLLLHYFSDTLIWDFQDAIERKSALHIAVEAQNAISTQWLLSHFPDPNKACQLKDIHGNTPLHTAAETNHSRLLTLLIPYSESLPSFKKKWHPLHMAASLGHVQACTLLLQAYKNPNVQDEEGMTAMHVACSEGLPQLITVLVKHGGDVNCKTLSGDAPLHFAASKPGVAPTLIQLGANVNSANAQGKTPLHIAVALGSIQFLAILLQAPNLDPDQHDAHGNTGLHIAVLQNRPQAARFLLDRNASPFIVNELGLTPAHLAVTLHAKELLPIFEMAINFVSTHKKTCLDYALELNDSELIGSVKSLGGLTYLQLNKPSSTSSLSQTSLKSTESHSNIKDSPSESVPKAKTQSINSVASEKGMLFGSIDLVSIYMKQLQGSLQQLSTKMESDISATTETNFIAASDVSTPMDTSKPYVSALITQTLSNSAVQSEFNSTTFLNPQENSPNLHHQEKPDILKQPSQQAITPPDKLNLSFTEPHRLHTLPNQVVEGHTPPDSEPCTDTLTRSKTKEKSYPFNPYFLTPITAPTLQQSTTQTSSQSHSPVSKRPILFPHSSTRPKLHHAPSLPLDWFHVAMPVAVPPIASVFKRPHSCFELHSHSLKPSALSQPDIRGMAQELGVSKLLQGKPGHPSTAYTPSASETMLKMKLKTLELEEANLLKQIAGIVDPLENSEPLLGHELPELMENSHQLLARLQSEEAELHAQLETPGLSLKN